jgi:hypothetical protein
MPAERVSTPGSYRLSFVVGGLLAEEAAIAAPIYLDLRGWQATRAALDRDNSLHARTWASAVRINRELIQRMETLTDDEVEYLGSAPGPDRKVLMWAAFCRRYALVAEFAEEVLRDKHLVGAVTLAAEDFDRFWAGKALWHEELEGLKDSTRTKLRTNLFLALRQAALLTEEGLIVPPLLTAEVTRFLEARTPSEVRFFPVGGAP